MGKSRQTVCGRPRRILRIFSLRWEIAYFHFAGISPNQNNSGCRFQESFFRISSGTYLTQQKNYCGNRCELSNWIWAAVIWQWSSSHLLSLKRFLSLPPRLANPLKKKACCLGGKTRASLYLQKKNRRPVVNHAWCQTFQKRKVVAHELRSFL